MQFFRSQKLIWTTTVLLLVAVVLPFSRAEQSSQTNDELTNWLLSFAYEQTSDAAHVKIASIKANQAPLHEVMQQASHIIFSNPELFRSPLGKTTNSDDEIYQVLLIQWTLQQEASGMAKGVQIERTRSVAYQPTSDTTQKTSFAILSDAARQRWTSVGLHVPGSENLVNIFIRPLLGGIAINAP
jgi:hypothetical protein